MDIKRGITMYVEIHSTGEYYRLPGHLDWQEIGNLSENELKHKIMEERNSRLSEYIKEGRVSPCVEVCFYSELWRFLPY